MIRPVNSTLFVLTSRLRQIKLTRTASDDSKTTTRRRRQKSDERSNSDDALSVREDPNVIPWLTSNQPAKLNDELLKKFTGVSQIVLKRGSSFFVKRGNRLIYSDSIKEFLGPIPKLGESVVICDPNLRVVGWGVFNPSSFYRVRVMQTIDECQENVDTVLDVVKTFQWRLKQAMELRTVLELPSPSTNAFRVVNSDGDHLSGVIVDKLDKIAVVHSGVSWLELNRQPIVAVLKSMLDVETVVWRLRPVIREEEGFPEAKEAIYSDKPDFGIHTEIGIVENGVHYEAAVGGQKTGFYVDQRENRLFLRGIARGKRVLDLCCYTGGFAINAAIGGASEVRAIDSSSDAIEIAKKNAKKNIVGSICRFDCGDILDRLQIFSANASSWDIVILDSPKLAFSRKTLKKSIGHYRKLNRTALKVVKPGGIFMTCSCSGIVSLEQFTNALWEAAGQIGRRLTILRVSHGGVDHVYDLNHPEGNYLKCIVARVM